MTYCSKCGEGFVHVRGSRECRDRQVHRADDLQARIDRALAALPICAHGTIPNPNCSYCDTRAELEGKPTPEESDE